VHLDARLVRPLHRTVVAVDIDGYGQRTDTERVRLRSALYDALTKALRHTNVSDDAYYSEDRGNSVLILISPEIPKNRLLADFLLNLTAMLHEHNLGQAGHLRLRVAIHAGEVIFDEYGVVGNTVRTVFLLLDSAAMRSGLHFVDADLIVGVTEPIYEGVIEPGFPGIDPASYRRVIADIKGANIPVWIYFPSATGTRTEAGITLPRCPRDLLHRSILLADIEDSDSRPDDIKWLHRDQLRSVVFDAIADIHFLPNHYAAKETGDGLRVLFTSGVAKNQLAGPLISAIAQRLVGYNAVAPTGAHMRLRVLLHAGEVLHDGSDFFGSALNEAFWMVDSDELRECLRNSSAPMVFMVSDVIYNGVVRRGYGDISPEEYQPCTVNGKKNQMGTWVRWPNPHQSPAS
jgi:class 3 adenylate cyclase